MSYHNSAETDMFKKALAEKKLVEKVLTRAMFC